MQPTPKSRSIDDYLAHTDVIDWKTPEVLALANDLGCDSEAATARRLYEWVRDEIPHSGDAKHDIVTCGASEVLRHRTGICYAKAHLLAALLRAVGIPAGLCYQVLQYDSSSNRLVVHGLNGIYLRSVGRWIRVDPRGNKAGVNAQFSVEQEQLAFPVDTIRGEFTCDTIFAEPLPSVVECLRKNRKVAELLANLPATITA
ncbi:MAG: transglutaminase family protein [Planctomycetaceae bacterium]|nr:transglutaminase family protein [Planctomycetaceae bacterium]